jgi:hypothetical protein
MGIGRRLPEVYPESAAPTTPTLAPVVQVAPGNAAGRTPLRRYGPSVDPRGT